MATNKAWATKALLKIFELQTDDEQNAACTHAYNNVGFTGIDAEILTSFAKQLIQRGFLTHKQMNIIYKKYQNIGHKLSIFLTHKPELQIRLSLLK